MSGQWNSMTGNPGGSLSGAHLQALCGLSKAEQVAYEKEQQEKANIINRLWYFLDHWDHWIERED